MTAGRTAPAAALLAAALAAGCGGGGGATAGAGAVHGGAHAVSPQGRPVKVVTPGVPKGEQTVRLKVIAAPDRETVALVPVYIEGHGPFAFAVDTGATQSVVDTGIARRLNLTREGSVGRIHGVTGSANGTAVAVRAWRAGRIALHPETLVAVPMGAQGPVGLLGSDVLSRYGKVALDYSRDLLLLDPPVK